MTNKTAWGWTIGIFLMGLAATVVVSWLSNSSVFTALFVLATVLAASAFITAHYANMGSWKWLLPMVVGTVLVGVIAVLGGRQVVEAIQGNVPDSGEVVSNGFDVYAPLPESGGGASPEDESAIEGVVPTPYPSPESSTGPAVGDVDNQDWEVNAISVLGEFIPHPTTFQVVTTIFEDRAWAQPNFSPPWPAHAENPDRQDCPMVNGTKVWCTIEVRPGDVIIYNADAISTPLGSYLEPSGGWFTNNTTTQIQVSFLYGELVVIEPGVGEETVNADTMARVMLRLVVSTNGLGSAAYLGQIPIH